MSSDRPDRVHNADERLCRRSGGDPERGDPYTGGVTVARFTEGAFLDGDVGACLMDQPLALVREPVMA